MHIHSLDKWGHSHDFVLVSRKGEKKTTQVLILTAMTMVIEIIAGAAFGSMALLADGWHMGTHAAAFAITIFAYRFSRMHSADRSFTFGTGKVSVLGGFASAVALAVVALIMALESVHRFFSPLSIMYNEAIAVAVAGLAVNLFSAWLLRTHSADVTHHAHAGVHDQHHHDHNLRGAYLHVMADALTSVLAIIALGFGKAFGWNWMDPVIGIAASFLIARWSYGLIRETGGILLDRNIDPAGVTAIRSAIEEDADNRVSDIHVWKVGPMDYAVMVSVVTHFPRNPDYYKKLLAAFDSLSHITIEVNHPGGTPCLDIADSRK